MDDSATLQRDGEIAPPLDMGAEEFRALGYRVVDRLAAFLATLSERAVAPDAAPAEVRARLGQGALPDDGADAEALLDEAASLVMEHNRLTGHPRQWGYIIGSAAPLGALGDFVASTVNPNVVSWTSSPMASEVEAQTVRWIAGLLGYPPDCGGLFTSGGNMANFIGFLAARRAKADWDVRKDGAAPPEGGRLRVYVSRETHTWVEKASDLFGLGTGAIRWIATDDTQRMDLDALRRQIAADRDAGDRPFLVVGTAGTVSTGAVDPLPGIAALAREEDLWFHVDGAYGAPAVVASGTPADLAGLREADSLAVDAHKWLYAPLEAGCALVRRRQFLTDAFTYRPPYYHRAADVGEVVDFHAMGLQNSRGFRALKVWLLLRRSGRDGLAAMIGHDLAMASELRHRLDDTAGIETAACGLSIVTFRYVPEDLILGAAAVESYLDDLNAALVTRIQRSGEAYLSNAVVAGRYLLRACITNFRTTAADVAALPGIVTRLGRELDQQMRPPGM